MTTLSIQVRGATIKRRGLERLGAEIPAIAASRLYDFMRRVRARIKAYPPAPSYPIRWDSEKQRRAFFATDGFGGGIPYRRTGIYGRSWYIRRNPRPSRSTPGYSLISNAEQRGRRYSRFVGGTAYGPGASRIHAGRWPNVRDSFDQELPSLPAQVRAHVMAVARRERL